MTLTDLLHTAQQAAHAAGAVHLKWRGHALDLHTKADPTDFVTQVDHEAEAAIRSVIHAAFPDHHLLGEESSAAFTGNLAQDECWVADPLDGTQNYVFGLPFSCVSIAFVRAGQVQVGVIHDPLHGETFTATRGGGAFLNGAPIRTSPRTHLDAPALLGTGFRRDITAHPGSLRPFLTVVERGLPVRRLSCSALSLAYIACGRMDGYWDEKLSAWDTAAGWLLIEEAGGVVTGTDGHPYTWGGPLLASNAHIHGELARLMPGERSAEPQPPGEDQQ